MEELSMQPEPQHRIFSLLLFYADYFDFEVDKVEWTDPLYGHQN